MRKIHIQSTLLAAMLIALFLFSNRTLAQTTDAWKEMVAGLSPADNTAFEYLLPVISSIPGISYKGFCAEHKCLLLLFDPAKYTEEQLANAFADRKIIIYPKENTTFMMITAECSITTSRVIDEK